MHLRLRAVIDANRGTTAFWAAAAAAAGAALWLWQPERLAPIEVALATLVLGAAGLGGGWLARRPDSLALRNAIHLVSYAAGMAFCVCLGALSAQGRIERVAAPRLDPEPAFHLVEGWVGSVDRAERGFRTTLLVASVSDVAAAPRRVRFLTPDQPLDLGRAVRCSAMLGGPKGADYPGGFDFARWAWFQQIGGVGWAVGRCAYAALPTPARLDDRLSLQAAAWRQRIALAVMAPDPKGQGRALAAAFITGDERWLERGTTEALRAAGLGHIVAISGLNLVLATGFAFLLLRWTLVFVPGLALRVRVSRIAAAGAIVAGTAYLVMCGAPASAERAWVMSSVGLLGMVLGRDPSARRALLAAGWAAILLEPEAVVSAGFQMSYAATAALVFLSRPIGERGDDRAEQRTAPAVFAVRFLYRKLAESAQSSVLAGAATSAFAAYHFGYWTTHGIAANLLAAPLLLFVALPMGALAGVLVPTGLGEWPLVPMSWALDRLVDIARSIQSAPDALIALPPMQPVVLVLMVLALLVLLIHRGPVRAGAPLLLVAGLGAWALAPRPIAIWTADAATVLARLPHRDGAALVGYRATTPGRETVAVERMAVVMRPGARSLVDLPSMGTCTGGACEVALESGRTLCFARDRADSATATSPSAPATPAPRTPSQDCVQAGPDSGLLQIHLGTVHLKRGRDQPRHPWDPWDLSCSAAQDPQACPGP